MLVTSECKVLSFLRISLPGVWGEEREMGERREGGRREKINTSPFLTPYVYVYLYIYIYVYSCSLFLMRGPWPLPPPSLLSLTLSLPSSPPLSPQYGEELIHDGVDQGVGQEPGPVQPDLGARVPGEREGGRKGETSRSERRDGKGEWRPTPYMMRPSRRELISDGVFWMEMTVLCSSSRNSVT